MRDARRASWMAPNRYLLPILLALAVNGLGCQPGGGAGATQAVESASASSSTSVVCDFFAPGGPGDDVRNAATSAIRGENPATATRDAIDGMQAIAQRASGDEREDLLALANAMNDAAMSGEDYSGWSSAYEAFYVKYAEQCGEELAD